MLSGFSLTLNDAQIMISQNLFYGGATRSHLRTIIDDHYLGLVDS